MIRKLNLLKTAIRYAETMATCCKPNRLALEKSPYLLQHATNPVDWYPWGEEAFTRALRENKLIFLSVGYSTCHWCHVMERESFENKDIAKILNENFICVKVDREERPDVDRLYMTFVQVNTGSGGWPMSVWLTPELNPVFGGTYFPPEDMYGRPGFRSVLEIIAKQWRENRQKFSDAGRKVLEVLEKATALDNVIVDPNSMNLPSKDCWELCMSQMIDSYEPMYGGFSRAPKFPEPGNIHFLLHVYGKSPESEMGKKALEMCTHTLRKMANGGIHDFVGKGFHRYSVDDEWHVPHFEKMLYDQGQLAAAFASAYLATRDKFFADIAEGILCYVDRDLSHPCGGFYSAEDADSLPATTCRERREGAYYVWKHDDIKKVLTQTVCEKPHLRYSDIFCRYFNVEPDGNVSLRKDPHRELRYQNVLIVKESIDAVADRFCLHPKSVEVIIEESLETLYDCRCSRPKPHLDDKMLTSWNGLMISGFAKVGQALCRPEYVQRAVGAAKFVRRYLYNCECKTLIRSCYNGADNCVIQSAIPINGFLDDYAFLIRGLLDVYEGSYDSFWIEWAEELQETQDRLFWDEGSAGYYTSCGGDSNILLRMKEDRDGAEPSGNSVSVHNLMRLATYLCRKDYKERAAKILSAFNSRLNKRPLILPEMVTGAMFFFDGPTQIYVTGRAENPDTAALLQTVHSHLIPGRILTLICDDEDDFLYRKNCVIQRMKSCDDKATAYVCRNRTCSLPVTTMEELCKLLEPPE
ncbi:UNVERIFIED_CONTAM: hypothetical protein PYX00_004307 [Menopon gallinae]|uniref:Spermatogenesis-associated protein 20-like TRX domain-containing protein n=1 Tax=Menopon gallinae TaxID=328185 RepID=A0AAW2I3Q6_9NEOP